MESQTGYKEPQIIIQLFRKIAVGRSKDVELHLFSLLNFIASVSLPLCPRYYCYCSNYDNDINYNSDDSKTINDDSDSNDYNTHK